MIISIYVVRIISEKIYKTALYKEPQGQGEKMLSKADVHLLFSLVDSFKTRGELDSENPFHRDTLSKSLRKAEEMGLILKTPREVDGRYTAEFNLTKRGRQITSIMKGLDIEGMPETGLTSQRMRIMIVCLDKKRFGELQKELDIAEPNVDRQLKILLASGLIRKGEDSYNTTEAGRSLIELLGEEVG
jgi:DNA-binding HxlR family transcriptional regulator